MAEFETGNLDHLSILVQLPASEVAAMTLSEGIRFEVQYVPNTISRNALYPILKHPIFFATLALRVGDRLRKLRASSLDAMPDGRRNRS